MTITIMLSPEQEARLLSGTARDGQDAPTAALHTAMNCRAIVAKPAYAG